MARGGLRCSQHNGWRRIVARTLLRRLLAQELRPRDATSSRGVDPCKWAVRSSVSPECAGQCVWCGGTFLRRGHTARVNPRHYISVLDELRERSVGVLFGGAGSFGAPARSWCDDENASCRVGRDTRCSRCLQAFPSDIRGPDTG